jgi:glycosyltransferase involved in cell wall biosynthesis
MKVLQVIPGNSINGSLLYSNFIENEIEGLRREGVEIKKFFFISRKSIFGLLNSKSKLEKEINLYKPDLIHVHTGSTTSFLVAISRKKKIPWIVTFGGSELLGNHQPSIKWKVRDKISILLSRISAKLSNGIICVSKNLQAILPNSTLKKSIVIPRGIDIQHFKPINKLEARGLLKINPERQIVIFSLNRKEAVVKNKVLADQVISVLQQKYRIDVSLISLIGYSRDEILLLLNAADALLITSLHEGSPNIVKEAMACNLPVVSVNCGDVKERLKDVKNSFVHSYDVKSLSESLNDVLNSRTRSNGREILLNQRLDRQSISLQISKFYKEVIDKHKF